MSFPSCDLFKPHCALYLLSREILDDSNFQKALGRIVEEPIPYFSQFSARFSKKTDGKTSYNSPIGFQAQHGLYSDSMLPENSLPCNRSGTEQLSLESCEEINKHLTRKVLVME